MASKSTQPRPDRGATRVQNAVVVLAAVVLAVLVVLALSQWFERLS